MLISVYVSYRFFYIVSVKQQHFDIGIGIVSVLTYQYRLNSRMSILVPVLYRFGFIDFGFMNTDIYRIGSQKYRYISVCRKKKRYPALIDKNNDINNLDCEEHNLIILKNQNNNNNCYQQLLNCLQKNQDSDNSGNGVN